jgi:phosphoglycolate phosphatase-like HAD superfamily hydrolase
LFEKIYCSDDVPNLVKKPAPDYLNYIASTHGLSHAWYIGNSVDDMRCATQAGYHALGVVTTFTAEALLQAGADVLKPSAAELVEVFACNHLLP